MIQSARITLQPTRVRYWVIVFAVTLAVVTYIDRVCISFAAPFITHDLGLTDVQMGWVLSAFVAAYGLFEMPCGYLADRIGPRTVLMRIVLWWSFFTAATAWAWSFPSLVATRFLFGMGEAGAFPNLTKIFTTWLPAHERIRAQAITWLSARWGGAFTPPLVALIMSWVGWRHSFEIFGCLGLVWAFFFYRWYRNDPQQHPRLNDAERNLLRDSSKLASGHGDVPWGTFLRSRQFWMLLWQYFCLSYGWYFYVTWLPTYLKNGRGLQLTSTALFSILPLFLGGLGNPVGMFAASRLAALTGSRAAARRIVSCIGFTGAAVFLFASTRAQSPLLATLAIALASFSGDLVMPNAWASAMDIGGKHAGTLSGAMNMWGNFGGALSPVVIGYILRFTGNNWDITFYVSAAIALFGILFWLLLDPVTPLPGSEMQ
jgi:MFS family permease